MKPLLYGSHDNHSTTKCFFSNYYKNVVKNYPISNASWDHKFQFQDSKLCEIFVFDRFHFLIEKVHNSTKNCLKIQSVKEVMPIFLYQKLYFLEKHPFLVIIAKY